MTRTRPRREEVRADILAAATEAVERNGYAGTTLTDVAAAAGYTGRQARVELALGSLDIDWAEDGEIYMAGPAAYSFRGTV